MGNDNTLMSVRGVKKYYPVVKGILRGRTLGYVKAVDDVSFEIKTGQTFGLVGESGCGKTTLSRLLLRAEKPTSGIIEFDGRDISGFDRVDLREYRSLVQPVFQDPYSSLSPTMQVWEIIAEPLIVQQKVSTASAKERAAYLLETVGLSPQSLSQYPHQFSGGQRQRIAIARALSCNPRFLVLDEPVSALDVSIRAQLMNMLKDLQKQFDLTFFIIAHDLGTIRYMSDTICVMYLGQIAEMGPADKVYSKALHPYTQALLSSALPFDPEDASKKFAIKGEIPSPLNPPSGCRFHTRCPFVLPRCSEEPPMLQEVEPGHYVSCHLY